LVSAQFQTFGNRRVNNVTEVVEKKLIYTRDAQIIQIHLYVVSDVHFIYSKIIGVLMEKEYVVNVTLKYWFL